MDQLRCPACEATLLGKNVAGMTVDVCHGGCGGVWFDGTELQRLDGRAAASLHSVWQREFRLRPPDEPRLCPRCPGEVLGRRWFSDAHEVEIDQCGRCDGVWLDDGEYTRIAREMRKPRFVPPGWAAALADVAAEIDRARP